jgi:hypothetical protein
MTSYTWLSTSLDVAGTAISDSQPTSVWVGPATPPNPSRYDLVIIDPADSGKVSRSRWKAATAGCAVSAGNEIALFSGAADGSGTLYSANEYSIGATGLRDGLRRDFGKLAAGNLDPETPCFTRGTRISTPDGERLVEDLAPGDPVLCDDGRMALVRSIGRKLLDAAVLSATPKMRPIRIVKGALGDGLPERDLRVSPRHRMMVRSRFARRVFGEAEVHLPACKLIGYEGVTVDETVQSVEYLHFVLDRNHTVYAEGAPAETVFTGRVASSAMSWDLPWPNSPTPALAEDAAPPLTPDYANPQSVSRRVFLSG